MENHGFDNGKYLQMQSQHIRKRLDAFGGKLYLEFGGKLFDDNHASRVLPGFQPDIKIKMLSRLADKVEIIVSINAHDIEKSKRRSDLDITYNQDALRLIDAFTGIGLYVSSVVITQYVSNAQVDAFRHQLENMGIKVYLHYAIDGYPTNVDKIVSDEGYGHSCRRGPFCTPL